MNDFVAALAPKSDQINAQDLIGGDQTITIVGVKVTPGTEQPVAIRFEGSDKVWRPCKTTGRILMAAWGADTSKYAGRSVQLYLDPKVKWGGLEVGGIRIRALSHIDGDLRLAVAESKQARKIVVIKPLPTHGGNAPAPQPSADNPETVAMQRTARQAARRGTDAFKAWWKDEASPDMRAAGKLILAELQELCAQSDAIMASDNADPFGLPSPADMDAAERAARDHANAQERIE
jgi:hypothetical protein